MLNTLHEAVCTFMTVFHWIF